MRSSGVVEGLMEMIRHPAATPRAKQAAAAALWALAGSGGTTHCRIVEAGGVSALLGLLRSEPVPTQEEALGALSNLMAHPAAKAELLQTSGQMSFLAELLYKGNGTLQAGVAGLFWSLADPSPPPQRQPAGSPARGAGQRDVLAVASLLQAGVPLGLVRVLRDSGEHSVRREALGALSALLKGGEAAERAVRDAGALHAMVRLLSGSHQEAFYACTAIETLATGDPATQAEVGDSRGLGSLVELCGAPVEKVSSQLQAAAASCLASLVVDPENSVQLRTRRGIPRLLAMLDFRLHPPATVEAACVAVTNLSIDPQNQYALRLAGGIAKLVEVLAASTCDGTAGHAAAALQNLFGDETCRAEAARVGGSEALVRWLRKGGEWTRQKVAGAVWSLAVGYHGATALKEAGAVQGLTMLVLYSNEEIQERAAGALWNLGRARAAEGRGPPTASDHWRHLEVSEMLTGEGVSEEEARDVRAIANRKVRRPTPGGWGSA